MEGLPSAFVRVSYLEAASPESRLAGSCQNQLFFFFSFFAVYLFQGLLYSANRDEMGVFVISHRRVNGLDPHAAAG